MSQNHKEKITVSVIICAYNEEHHLQQTLTDLLNCPTAEEIIVVNDGSIDRTEKILKKFGKKIKLISYRKNRGKGFALQRGIKAAQGKIIVFLDAHLKNLKDRHLKKLIQPILAEKTNFVLASCGPKPDQFVSITGVRSYLKQILMPFLNHLKKTRFGVESYLNAIFQPRWGLVIDLPDLIHLTKLQKLPLNEALPAYLQEIREISKTKVEIALLQHQQLKKILTPKKIKTLKNLRRKIKEIGDQEVAELLRKNLLPYLRKITQ